MLRVHRSTATNTRSTDEPPLDHQDAVDKVTSGVVRQEGIWYPFLESIFTSELCLHLRLCG